MLYSERNWQLLQAMATGIRLLAPHQLARWWGVPITNAKRSLRELCDSGFLKETIVRARRLPPITQPLLQWKPTQPTPNFGALSYQAKERFRELAPVLFAAYTPTTRALSQFTVRHHAKLRRSQATHELGVTESYLYALTRWPRLTQRCWRGENLYARDRGHGEKVEDAHFVNPQTGKVMLAIEYAGTYHKHRFETLHEALKHNPYWIM